MITASPFGFCGCKGTSKNRDCQTFAFIFSKKLETKYNLRIITPLFIKKMKKGNDIIRKMGNFAQKY